MECLLCSKQNKSLNHGLVCEPCGRRIAESRIAFIRWFIRLGRRDRALQQQFFEHLDSAQSTELIEGMLENKYLAFEPLPHQRGWLYCDAYVKAFLAGNQSGKTQAGVINDLWDILGEYPEEYPERFRFSPPTVGRIWVPDFSVIDPTILPKFREWFPDWPSNHRSNRTWDIRRNVQGAVHKVLHIPTGSSFDFCSGTQDPAIAEGWVGHWSHSDEAIGRRQFTGTLRGLMANQGQMRITFTPITEPWIHKEIVQKQKKGEIEVFTVDIWANAKSRGGYVDDIRIKEMLARAPEHERAAREKGIFIHISRSVYPDLFRYPEIFQDIDQIPKDWIIATATDYHQATAIHTLWVAVNQFDQKIFFDQLILGNVSIERYVDEMLAIEAKWGANRVVARLVDRTVDQKYQVILNEGLQVFNPFDEFCQLLVTKGSIGMEKVTGSSGAIPKVRFMLKPRFEPKLGKDIQPFIIGQHCRELRETLPEYSYSEHSTGPMKGESKEEVSKKEAGGAHTIDCFNYLMAYDLRYSQAVAAPPPPGTIGYEIRKEIAAKQMAKREVVGSVPIN